MNVQSKFCSAEVTVVIQERSRDSRFALGVTAMSLYWLMRAGRERISRDRIKPKDGVDEEEVAKSVGKSSRRLEKT